ncbi:MAG: hypothetical protein J7K46_12260 [Bacteroidales bacterium]|nr:hypothetical protein [Bacteroidales bacterium]
MKRMKNNQKKHFIFFRVRGLSLLVAILLLFTSCHKTDNFQGYLTTVGSGDNAIRVVVVKGTPYEMGQQLGTLMKGEIGQCLNGFLETALQEAPEGFGNDQLDLVWKINSAHIDQRVLDEMKGMADASGIDLKLIQRAHMVPVVSPYACSGVAVWGQATETGHTYHLRNLDFTMDAHLQDYPLIVIYVPDSGAIHVNVTFAGYIASHTGMNSNHLVFGEKGEAPNSEFPYETNGAHFSFLFRKMMYDDKTLEDVLNTIRNTTLIKRYFLFFSDGNKETQGGAKVLVSAPDSIRYHIWKDNDSSDIVAPNILPDIIYYTMNNPLAFKMLKEGYGKFNEQKMIDLSRAVADEGGNLMDVVYDATTLEMWVAYANGTEEASKQDYVHVSVDQILEQAGLK